MTERRVRFDFRADFSNGGSIQGSDFRLDIDGDDIADDALAERVIADLRLLMVATMTITHKQVFVEAHKRRTTKSAVDRTDARMLFDLSLVIEDGMVTYRGLPAPLICDHLSRERSRSVYAPGTEFQIDRIDMVGNTGTYIDTPFHRYADGHDLADTPLDRVAHCPAIVIDVTGATERVIGWMHFAPFDVAGKAVLVQTGWDRHWRTDRYFEGHPHLDEAAAVHLRDRGAILVGIDSLNIDDTSGGERPVHTVLLGAGIPIVEHLTGLRHVRGRDLRFTAAAPGVRGMGTFPVRAFASATADEADEGTASM